MKDPISRLLFDILALDTEINRLALHMVRQIVIVRMAGRVHAVEYWTN